jgi:hypothetical protein
MLLGIQFGLGLNHTRARARPPARPSGAARRASVALRCVRVRFIFAPILFIYLFNFSLILFDWIKV